jgi:hypothetical protein
MIEHGILPPQGIFFCGGELKVGKSFLVANLAFCVGYWFYLHTQVSYPAKDFCTYYYGPQTGNACEEPGGKYR